MEEYEMNNEKQLNLKENVLKVLGSYNSAFYHIDVNFDWRTNMPNLLHYPESMGQMANELAVLYTMGIFWGFIEESHNGCPQKDICSQRNGDPNCATPMPWKFPGKCNFKYIWMTMGARVKEMRPLEYIFQILFRNINEPI